MRIDLTDTTFIIPVRIDSMIRLENLLMSCGLNSTLFPDTHLNYGGLIIPK